MEKNCDMTGEMGDHLPILRPGEDQSSSESPVVAKPLPKDTNWVDLFVKEITSASDPDDARNRAAKALKAFEASVRARSIPKVTRYLLELAKVVGNFEGSLDQGSLDYIWEHEDDIDYIVKPDGKIRALVFGLIDDSDSDTNEEDDLKYKQLEERLMRVKLGIDENGRMPEHIKRYWEKFGGLEAYGFDPLTILNKQPMDMVDGNEDKK